MALLKVSKNFGEKLSEEVIESLNVALNLAMSGSDEKCIPYLYSYYRKK